MPSPLRLGFVLLVYNLLLPVVLLVSLPGYIVKMIRRGGYGGHLPQRFGWYPEEVDRRLAQGKGPMWVHAVSVGEVLIAAKTIDDLHRQSPGHPVVLSTTTSTGYAIAKERFGEDVTVIFNPLDFPWVAYSVLRQIDPSQLVLVEAEVWPNLVCIARWMGIPVHLINARLSERSERRLARFGWLVRPIYAQLSRVLVQSEGDKARMASIGARPEVVEMIGSIKYDPQGAERPELADELSEKLERLVGNDRPVVLAGSTHGGEEELLGAACLKIRESVPDLFYIAVPRHFERCDKIVARMRSVGLRPLLRTEIDSAADGCCQVEGEFDSLIVNTTGELRAWYYLATVAVIGKSFLSRGGQNPVEAILAEKPVLSGPEMSNFTSLVVELEKAGGMIRVSDSDELADVVTEILAKPEKGIKMTAAALSVIASHQGATERTVRRLLDRVGEKA